MEGSSSKRPLENPEENSNPSKKVRKAYTLEFKRNVIDEVKSSNNLRATASRYGLDHTVVLRWRKAFEKQSSNSNQNQNTKFRMSGAGRPVGRCYKSGGVTNIRSGKFSGVTNRVVF